MEDRDLEYQRLACETLGLIHPADREDYNGLLLELGHFRIIESEAATRAVVERYLWKLRELMDEFETGLQRRREALEYGDTRRQQLDRMHGQFRDETKTHSVLLPDDFLRFNGRGDTEEKREGFAQGRAYVRQVAREELARLQRFTTFTSDFHGYCKYLDRACPDLFFRLSADIPALIPEKPHTEHSYILSTTGTGKSELLKALVLNYVQHPDYCSVMVLDPGGDMTPEIARWPELMGSDRLVYIEPAMNDTHVPVINPFDVEGLTPRERGLLTGQIVAVLGTLIEGKMGGGISVPMEAALYPAVRLLIDLPNTSIADLAEIMRGDPRLISLGQQSPVTQVRKFFLNDFEDMNELTKKSIVNKINSLLGKGMLEAILCGHNSVDLKTALNSNKIVLANLAKGALDPMESNAIGLMLVAMAQSIGMERAHIPKGQRPMTHLIVDECQNFVTGELKGIIRETRKFGLSVTLAQQELGGDMPADLRNTVVKTTNVKIAGRSASTETRKTGDLVGVSGEAIRRCDPGQFYYQAGNKPAFLLRVRSDRLNHKTGVGWNTWAKIKEHQLKRYYRPLGGEAPDTPPPEAEAPPPAPPNGSGSPFTFE